MTKEEIIQAISDDKMMPFVQPEQLAQIVEFVINNYQPSLPSNLDEAAEEYGRKECSHAIHFWDEGLSKNKPEVMKEDFVDSFKAGAEWMAGQGASFNTKVGWIDGPTILDWPDDILDKFEIGDEVIVQIRKNNPAKA